MKNSNLVFVMGIFLIIASIITAIYQDWGQTGSLLLDAFLLIVLSIYINSNTNKDKIIKKQQEDLRTTKDLVDALAEVQKKEEEEDKNDGGEGK